ncbi:hypothetical protein K439DRAFT_246100 [Ramaria rubella]|nr:hypothetical protein K439DRAFT_246100 [Ramaria rubella]
MVVVDFFFFVLLVESDVYPWEGGGFHRTVSSEGHGSGGGASGQCYILRGGDVASPRRVVALNRGVGAWGACDGWTMASWSACVPGSDDGRWAPCIAKPGVNGEGAAAKVLRIGNKGVGGHGGDSPRGAMIDVRWTRMELARWPSRGE